MKLVWSGNVLDALWIRRGAMRIRTVGLTNVRGKTLAITGCSVKGGATKMAFV
jgi:hypothetical protein